jgi:hypothetical protein
MKAKRFLVPAIILIVAAIGCFLLVIQKPQAGHLDAKKIIAAIQAYSSNVKVQKQTLPESVSLQELIAKGYLKHEDVSAFDGWNVTVSLNVSETNPQSVLMSAQSPDGDQLVVMADGSVQSLK